MRQLLRNTIIKELAWLTVIMAVSVLVEFLIIEFFDLHPVLSVKAQGFVGLLLIGYAIRMFARISLVAKDDAQSYPKETGN